MKLHIWTDEVSYLAVCHADSVADAREMLAVEVGGQDGSCPERAKAWKDISENNSAPYNGRVAAFCLSDSAEVREQLAYSEKVCAERDASRARITELEAALEAKHQQYTGAVIQLTEARKDGERLSEVRAIIQCYRGRADGCNPQVLLDAVANAIGGTR